MKCSARLCIHLFLYIGVVLALCSLHSVSVIAAQLDFRPSLNVRETYTDNVRFGGGSGGAGGRATGGDLITQINPGLALNATGQRFDLNANYLMNNLIYAKNSNLTRIRHTLNASATTEVLRDLFFIDGSAMIAQQNISLLGAQTTDNVFVTGNRRTIQFYNVSPYIRYQFQNFATTELRYARGIVESGVNGLRDSQRDSYLFSLNSGSTFTKLAWALNYSNNRIHFDRSDRTIELERSIASLRYNLNPRFGLTATGGYERNSFISIRGKNSSPTWTAGFVWAPNRRMDMEFRAGQRFFGDTYYGDVNYRTRLMGLRLLYSEDITTFNQQAGQFGSFGAINNFGVFSGIGFQDSILGLNNFLTNRVFLQKRFNASVAFNGSKNNIVLNVFRLTRKPYTAEELDADLLGLNNFLFLRDTRQTGGNVAWSYRFSPRTSLNMNFSFVRFDFLSVDRTSDNLIFSTSIIKNFTPDLNGGLEYRHIERLSKIQSGNQSFDFSANAVTVFLTKHF